MLNSQQLGSLGTTQVSTLETADLVAIGTAGLRTLEQQPGSPPLTTGEIVALTSAQVTLLDGRWLA